MTPRKLLEGKVALVTGAGRGIGRAEALALADAGAAVVVNDVGMEMDESLGSDTMAESVAETVAEEIRDRGGRAVATTDSVSDWSAASGIVQTAIREYGRLDIVVNNAGFTKYQLFDEVTEHDFDLLLEVNLKGTFAICRHASELFIRQGHGRIINTASNQWSSPTGGAAYVAAKGGVVSLTYDLAWELRSWGITVNAIAPFASTRLTEDLDRWKGSLVDRQLMSQTRQRNMEQRAAPEMVAPLVLFLASDAAANVSGHVFRVGGSKIGIYQHPLEIRTIYGDEHRGPWDVADLIDLLPATLLAEGSLAPHLR